MVGERTSDVCANVSGKAAADDDFRVRVKVKVRVRV